MVGRRRSSSSLVIGAITVKVIGLSLSSFGSPLFAPYVFKFLEQSINILSLHVCNTLHTVFEVSRLLFSARCGHVKMNLVVPMALHCLCGRCLDAASAWSLVTLQLFHSGEEDCCHGLTEAGHSIANLAAFTWMIDYLDLM